MSWTYGADPENSIIDRVRLLIGDTKQEEPLLEDAIITYELTRHEQNERRAALALLDHLIAQFAHYNDVSATGASERLSQRYSQLKDLRQRLNMDLGGAGAPILTGMYAREFEAYRQDITLSQPLFRRGARRFDVEGG